MPIIDAIQRHKTEVDKLRDSFLCSRYAKEPDLYDPRDIDKVRQNDWSVWRFLRTEKYNFESALEKLDKCMRWRKEMRMNDREDRDAPKEFYECGGIFVYNHDKSGTPVIFMRIKVNLKVAKLSKYIKDFMTYTIDRVDQRSNENGFAIVFDLTDAGIRNADLDLCSYLITILRFYFPEGLRYCLVYNLPWILRSFWPIVRMWIPAEHKELVQFANKDQIKDYIDSEQLPQHLGGQCTKNFASAPPECLSVSAMGAELGITSEEIDDYLKIYEPIIKETKKCFQI